MKPMIKRKVLLLFFTIVLINSLTVSLKAEIDKDSIKAEIYLMIEHADSVLETANYDSAIVLGNLALEQAEIGLGLKDRTVAYVLNRIGAYHYHKAEFEESISYHKRALTIREEALGPDHLDVATSMMILGAVYGKQQNFTEAEKLHKRALVIREKALGPDHLDVAACYSNLAYQYWFQGKDAEAESLFTRVLEVREKVLEPDDPLINSCLYSLGQIYYNHGRYIEAEPFFKRLLANNENTHGSDHPDIAWELSYLSKLYIIQGRYTEAVPLCRKILALTKSIFEQEPPDNYGTMIDLSDVYSLLGEYDEVEWIYKRSLSMAEKRQGMEHYDLTFYLTNLALFYHDLRKYDEAAKYYKRAVDIFEKVHDPNAPELAYRIDDLANLYHDQGKYEETEKLYKRSLTIKKNAFGLEHLSAANSIESLARLYHDQGKYTEAEQLYVQVIALREKIFDPEHLDIASCLDKLANLYNDQNKYSEAERFLKRALAIREKKLVPEHPDISRSLNDLARLYFSMGEIDLALEYFEKQQKSRQNFIDYAFSYAYEGLKMRYIQEFPLLDHSFFSFALMNKPTAARRPALEMTLKSKAVIIDAISAEKEIAYCSYDEALIAEVENHAETCGEIATLALVGAESHEPEKYRERMRTLNNIKDSLETELSRNCAEFKDALASRRFTVEDVANALPEGGILLEYVRYEPYDFEKTGNDEERTGSPRYLAFTLNYANEITLTDLGDAMEIDSLVTLARKMIYNSGTEIHTVGDAIAEARLSKATHRLYNLLIAPLDSYLSNRAQIFISPDGQLSLLPFEILPDNNGEYAIEKYNISYLSSGRDLLKFMKKPEYSDWALAMADPDFDLSHPDLTESRDKTLNNSEHLIFAYEPSRGASGCLNTRFNSLPYTDKETKSVVKTLKNKAKLDVDAYYGDKALEEVLKGMTISPRVLHLSTHGYFCEDIDLTENKMLENPLLRSGLVLAGANRLMGESAEDTTQIEDGILTAFEVSGLNLSGTELVTLSACETGVGEVQNGEGVYGLRRAFQHAGARTILMSLWKVPDKETHDLMDNFYKNWLSGQTKQAAFRQSALKVIEDRRKKHDAAHPYYWGAFVMVGDPE